MDARLIGVGAIALAVAAIASGQVDETFQAAVRSYVELRRAAAASAPSTASGADVPYAVQQALAQRIQSSRPNARQGDIVGPVASRIREVVQLEFSGRQGAAMLAVIDNTNVHGVRVRVNRRYPPALPRVTMPAPLLSNLPALPAGLEYRFLGRSLLLVDTDAGLVVDLIPDVLPQSGVRRAASQ